MLPMVGRLRDLMPKTVKDVPLSARPLELQRPTLDSLPILKCWPDDGGRYITPRLVFTKHPEYWGTTTFGTYRMQVYDGPHLPACTGSGSARNITASPRRWASGSEVAPSLAEVWRRLTTAPMPRASTSRRGSEAFCSRKRQPAEMHHRRSRGAGELTSRFEGYVGAGGAPPATVRRPHRPLFAAGRLSGVPHHWTAAQEADLPDHGGGVSSRVLRPSERVVWEWRSPRMSSSSISSGSLPSRAAFSSPRPSRSSGSM